MAPRGRGRKVGLKRMDAAIDALTPMGYSPDFICKKVKELLDVYGGDEAWSIIEEASYSLLIEYILGEEEGGQCERREPSSQDSPTESRGEGCKEAEPAEAGPSHEASEALCCEQDAPSLSPVTVLNPPVHAAETRITLSNQNALVEVNQELAALKEACLRPQEFDHFQLPQDPATGKRRPCLGWIGPKDYDDFVLLKPAPVQGWKVSERRRKGKSRWDVGPDDCL